MASEIKVDTVSEKTSANGITIDGLNIKDAKLVTANSVIEANMSANSVDSDSYVDGSIDTAHIADLNVTTGKIAADAITGAKIADDAINSEHYTDGSIDTAHIADGQITTAKLATAVLTGATDIGAAIADADLLLVDDGAGGTLRKTVASRLKTYIGGYILLNETVITSSTANVIWDNSYLTTAYKNYFITITGLTMVTDNTGLALSCSTDNGSNFNLQLYGAWQGFSTDGSDNFATTSGQPGAAGAVNTIAYISNVAAEISNVEFSVYEPMNASTITVIRMEGAQKTAGNLYDHQSGVLVASATGDMDAIKFASSSGNIATGTFRIYGVK